VTTHLIPATLAFMTDIADGTGFEGDSIPRFQVSHFWTNFIWSVRKHPALEVKMINLGQLFPRTHGQEPENE